MKSALVLGVLFWAGCVTGPSSTDLASPLPSWPAYYADVWARCGSTLRQTPAIPYHKLRFHAVPGEYFFKDGRPVIGTTRGRDIYIAEALWTWPVVVRHEMLHAQYGVPGHPEPIFPRCDSIAAGLIP